ncbi:MAG TPA: uracil phosphoribosyltransferase [Rhabdochlamydiaceae bacterium]
MNSFKVCLLLALTLCVSRACPDILKDRLVLSHLVHDIRNPQTDKKHFREALEKIGEYLALEVLQDLDTKHVEIETLTGAKAVHVLCDEDPVLITILRGGVPMLVGMQQVFPNAEAGFLGMARNEETLKAAISYIGIPNVKDKCVIISDTMLATGGSMLDAIKIVEKQNPKQIILVCAIAAKKGIARILDYNPNIKIYAAVTDPLLNEKGYIIPGLGDAGDRSYGMKHE